MRSQLSSATTELIEGDIEIAQPPETVFDIVADERNEPRYNPRLREVEKLTVGPIGRGTRFRVRTARRRGGAEMIIEYTEFDPPHRLASSHQPRTDGDRLFPHIRTDGARHPDALVRRAAPSRPADPPETRPELDRQAPREGDLEQP